ncbi:MAG: TPM domain-containing protein [Sphingobium sp.]|nr:TPM domain-containing protein [Sphingobium sp.]
MVRQAALCLIALLSLLPATAWADPTFPQLTGRVVDDAHLLSPEQTQAITTKLATLEQHTGRQLVVVTLPDLQGYEISDYGYQLGRHWGIGEKDKNTGALLIVAPNERRARIEVGYGLEPVLTDGLSSLIINQNMIPHFKDKDYPGGIEAGVNEIVRIIELPPDQQRALAQQVSRPRHNVHAGDVFKAILIVFAILFFIIISAVRAATRGGRRYRRGGGVSPIVVWAASEAIGAALRNNDRHGGWGGGGDSGGGFGGFGGGGDGGGFSGGGGSFGGGGASGGW